MKMKTNFILLILAASLVFAKQSMAEMYTLLIYETKVAVDSRFKNGKANDNYWNEFNHFAGQLQQAGVLRGGTAFKAGDQIKTVVLKDGKITVSSGAHAKSKEILGGNLIIDVPSMDVALDYAKKAPQRDGMAIEVRAPQENPTMGTMKKPEAK